MRLMNVNYLISGQVLGQAIYSETGSVLLQQGVTLTKKMIQRLVERGISYVYIEDGRAEGIQIESTIPNVLKVEAIQEVKEIFSVFSNKQFPNKSYILDGKDSNLATIIDQMINQIHVKDGAISMLADIFITDNYTFQHSLNVALYSIAIGKQLELPNMKVFELGIGAILHDIGKVFIDQDILKKPGKLTDNEFELMKTHTKQGFDYIRKHTDLSTVIAHCAYQHHERLDGSGYPRQLVGDDIHLFAQIIGIADVFDAVTSNRIYREALLPHEGLEILYADAVYKFDKQLVELFKKSITVYPNGLTVQLSDGRTAVVAKQNKHMCDRPIVKIIKEWGKEVEPYEIDLSSIGSITIKSCSVA